MIFKRKNRARSPASIGDDIDEKRVSKAETFYAAFVCFAAACLSFMRLEVASRSSLGQSVTKSATFNAIFRRSYNVKIRIMTTNVVTGLITTIILALGDVYGVPYLHVPWLINTMRGMIFYQGPTLFGLSKVWLPDAGIPAGTFVFITFLLFVEELCLWFDVVASLKRCWEEYNDRKRQNSHHELPTADKAGLCSVGEPNDIVQAAAKSRLLDDDNFQSIVKPTSILVNASSTYAEATTRLRSTKSSEGGKRSGR